MRWSVEGAEKETGKSVAMAVEAPSQEQAISFAQKKGILVAGIKQSAVADDKDENGIPQYSAIRNGVAVIRLAAIIYFVIAVLYAATQAGMSIHDGNLGGAIMAVAVGALVFCFGVILLLLAGLSLAIRDMARNSFKK
jgi:hypothetical protein